MSSAKAKFISDLGSFLAQAESTVPDTARVDEHYKNKILAQRARESQLQEDLAAIRRAIADSSKEQQNARLFSAAVRQTLQHVDKFAPEMQIELRAARDAHQQQHRLQEEQAQRKRQRRQLQAQDQQQLVTGAGAADDSPAPGTWFRQEPAIEFSEVYDLQVTKAAAEIGLVLENDTYGVRIVDVDARLQQAHPHVQSGDYLLAVGDESVKTRSHMSVAQYIRDLAVGIENSLTLGRHPRIVPQCSPASMSHNPLSVVDMNSAGGDGPMNSSSSSSSSSSSNNSSSSNRTSSASGADGGSCGVGAGGSSRAVGSAGNDCSSGWSVGADSLHVPRPAQGISRRGGDGCDAALQEHTLDAARQNVLKLHSMALDAHAQLSGFHRDKSKALMHEVQKHAAAQKRRRGILLCLQKLDTTEDDAALLAEGRANIERIMPEINRDLGTTSEKEVKLRAELKELDCCQKMLQPWLRMQ